ncbi:MAG: bifunctional folylpolyglutamate synthase/dihydrofolate synthase, partial [candidate division Zixibacteria bacterium]|nr:bifunctional folylpolyglutamate synthase/dihydrofolate synthase [candidate division Zixibacteria bacterium]
MNYRQCLAFLYNLQRLGIKLGLVNVESFLNYVGNPQHSFPSIHIAGTNGKGSVCAMLESVLNHSGYKTGLYTSPHLVSFRERVRISGREMETDFITEFVNRHRDRIARQQLTFFEATTALAFLYFQQKKVDIAVIETGLGGRLDATNTILPEAAGITGIGMEHTDILGKTLRKIAFEKAGIIKPGKPTVVGKVSRQVGIQLK